jgi:fluoride ion exporter CrcB/FEX
LGFFGGWFAVPLNALLQQKPADDEKGRILATNNVANTIGILFASAVLYWLGDRMHFSASQILGIAGAFTLLSTIFSRDPSGLRGAIRAAGCWRTRHTASRSSAARTFP